MIRFVDTSGWAAWLSRREPSHSLARTVVTETRRAKGRLITTNWILTELTALLTSPMRISKLTQIEFFDSMRSWNGLVIATVDPVLEAEAWNLWRARPDKTWSLVDCASFVLMKQRGLTDAITSDQHFEQAGFNRVLKPSIP